MLWCFCCILCNNEGISQIIMKNNRHHIEVYNRSNQNFSHYGVSCSVFNIVRQKGITQQNGYDWCIITYVYCNNGTAQHCYEYSKSTYG